MKVKAKHIVIGSVVVIGLTALTWYLVDRDKKAQEKKKKEAKKAKPSGYNEPVKRKGKNKKRPVPVADEFPLRLGSKGKRVERLNIWLMRNFGHTGIITDVFDEITAHQLMKALKRKELDEVAYKKYGMDKSVHEQKIMQ